MILRSFWKKIVLAAVFSFAAACVDAKSTLRIACRSKGIEKELLQDLINEWKEGKDVDVEIITLPRASNECFVLYQQLLFSKQCDLDIILLDIAWVGSFVNHLEDLSQYDIVKENRQKYFDSIENTINVNGKLIALPMYADVGVFFYRKDLLEKYDKPVPNTWEEMYQTAKYIQEKERCAGNKNFYGYVFQAKASEILMCVFSEVLYSFGGEIASLDKVFLDSDLSKQSVGFLQKCYREISPIGVTNHSEEESRGIFQCGNALFMRNWPYAALAGHCENLRGKVGMMIMPAGKGENHTGTLGGWNLGMPKFSKNKSLAVDLIVFLARPESQKMRAIKGHYPPAIESLYSDSEILKDNPNFSILKQALKSAISRPSRFFGRNYQKVSTLMSGTINTAISESFNDKYNLNRDLRKLNQKLDRLLVSKPTRKRIGVIHKTRIWLEDKFKKKEK